MKAGRLRTLELLRLVEKNGRMKVDDAIGWAMEQFEFGGMQGRNMVRDLELLKYTTNVAGRLTITAKGRETLAQMRAAQPENSRPTSSIVDSSNPLARVSS